MNKPRLPDIFIIIFSLILGIFILIKNGRHIAEKVHVQTESFEYEYDLNKNGIYEIQGTLGITKIEISDSQVRIIESPCPNKTCILQGFGNVIVCLPNQVVVEVKSSGDEIDAIAN